MSTSTILIPVLLAALAAGDATEVVLKDGTKLVGEVKGHDEVALVLVIRLGGEVSGSVRRPVRWTEIESIDGLTIAEWLEEEAAARSEEPTAPPSAATGPLLERFRAFMGSREGFAVGQAIVAIAILILVPAFLLHRAGKLMGMRELEGVRSLGAALLALGAGWAALEVEPGWWGGVPWSAVGAIAVLVWLVMRPTVGRWLVLAGLEIGVLAGLIAGILEVARLLP